MCVDLGQAAPVVSPPSDTHWAAVLAEELGRLPSRFTARQFAYLAATRKVEDPVRDALASNLYDRLEPAGLRVARELSPRRRDLAVLDAAAEPVLLLEAKALYGYDVCDPDGRNDYLLGPTASHRADVAKMATEIRTGVACFLLSVITHPLAVIPSNLVRVLKYALPGRGYRGHNAWVATLGSAAAVRETATAQWPKLLVATWGPVIHRGWELGEVYGVPYALDAYLVGLLTAEAADRAER
jgi:hypothetical protein